MDGPSPAEKGATNDERGAKRAKSLPKAKKLMTDMEDAFTNNNKLRKQQFKAIDKAIVESFYFTHDLRRALVRYLVGNGWTVCSCASESDTCIGSECTRDEVVITRDSDALVYCNIATIWRPFGYGKCLVYDVPLLLKHVGISRAGLTTLGVVSQNDYGKGVKRLGITTNFKVISELEEKPASSVYDLVEAYLANIKVAAKHPVDKLFDAALRIFTLQEFTIVALPSTQDLAVDLQNIVQRLAELRTQLKIRRTLARTCIIVNTGEIASVATKDDMHLNELLFGTVSQSGGRKTDTLVLAKEVSGGEVHYIECSVNEHKPLHVGQATLTEQSRKVIRINRSILASTGSKQIVVFIDAYGLCGRIYSMRAIEDIFGVSTVLGK
ncbi:hypothetical protein BGZ83_002230, partial [Gryganskiella cystojenkinii]